MNEHPGVRPTIVEPQAPFSKPLRSLPRNTRVMPVGLSANSVGLDGRTNHARKVLFIGVPLTILLAVCLGTWLFARSLSPLTQKTIVNGAYEYSFVFYEDAEPVNLVAGEGFNHNNKALVIAKPSNDDVTKTCEQMNTRHKQWKEAFRAEVMGVERPVCRLKDNVYMVTFFQNSAEHLMEISYAAPLDTNSNDVRKIVESLRVTLQ